MVHHPLTRCSSTQMIDSPVKPTTYLTFLGVPDLLNNSRMFNYPAYYHTPSNGLPLLVPLGHVSDIVHLATKTCNCLSKGMLVVGSKGGFASFNVLKELFGEPARAVAVEAATRLAWHHLNRKNARQEFRSAQLVLQRVVWESLEKLLPPSPSRDATVVVLKALHYVVHSFLEPTLQPLTRITYVFAGRFFLEVWRADLQARGIPLKGNFFSSNVFEGVLMNSDYLLAYTLWLCQHPELHNSIPYAPWLFGSLSNEHLFRSMRFNTHGNINFTVADAVRLIMRMDAAEVIMAANRDKFSMGPGHHKQWRLDELYHVALRLTQGVNSQQVIDAMNDGVSLARSLCDVVGITCGVEMPPNEPASPNDLDDVDLAMLLPPTPHVHNVLRGAGGCYNNATDSDSTGSDTCDELDFLAKQVRALAPHTNSFSRLLYHSLAPRQHPRQQRTSRRSRSLTTMTMSVFQRHPASSSNNCRTTRVCLHATRHFKALLSTTRARWRSCCPTVVLSRASKPVTSSLPTQRAVAIAKCASA